MPIVCILMVPSLRISNVSSSQVTKVHRSEQSTQWCFSPCHEGFDWQAETLNNLEQLVVITGDILSATGPARHDSGL